MDNNFWALGIMFLCVLSMVKYYDIEQLRMWIEDFIERISPLEVIKGDDVVELDEVADIIMDFVIRNQEIFSRIKVNNDLNKEGDNGN